MTGRADAGEEEALRDDVRALHEEVQAVQRKLDAASAARREAALTYWRRVHGIAPGAVVEDLYYHHAVKVVSVEPTLYAMEYDVLPAVVGVARRADGTWGSARRTPGRYKVVEPCYGEG
jgi:hypothetical protein